MKKNLLLSVSALLFSYFLMAQTDTTINGVTYTLFAPGLWVEVEAAPFTCGDDITFMYNGSMVTYGTVESNGNCWMDRNLGASQVATSSTDHLSYGDLFQWGRGDDEHQLMTWTNSTSGTSVNASQEGQSSSPTPGDYFLHGSNNWYTGSDPDELWIEYGTGVNNPCPPGWRVPTEAEWNAERNSWSPNNNATGAIDSPLKLPLAGFRSNNTGNLILGGIVGFYWSSTVSSADSRHLNVNSSNASVSTSNRAFGLSVRCLKN